MIQIKILPNHKQAAYIAIGAANARIIKNHLLNLKKSKRLTLLPWSVNLLPSKVHIIAAINKKIIAILKQEYLIFIYRSNFNAIAADTGRNSP